MKARESGRSVVVIGGGVSGLSAAYYLREMDPTLKVSLLERQQRLGGVVQTRKRGGFLMEGAADSFFTATPCALELCNSLGLDTDLIRSKPRGGTMVLSRGRLEPIPRGLAAMSRRCLWPILASRILSPLGKLRTGLEFFLPGKKITDESLESFVCRRFGREVYDRIAGPLAAGIYAADPSRMSVATTVPRLHEWEREYGSLLRGMLSKSELGRRATDATPNEPTEAAYNSHLVAPQGGMARLVEALSDSLPARQIHLGTGAVSLAQTGGQWLVETDTGASLHADGVVIASPANHAGNLLSRTDPVISEVLNAVEYEGCAMVSLGFRRDQINVPLEAFGFVVPANEQRMILACTFSSQKFSGRAPQDAVLLRVFMGGALQPGVLRLPAAQLAELAYREVADLLGVSGKPIMQDVVRHQNVIPQYSVGHQSRMRSLRQRLVQFPTLALAGSAMTAVGIPRCLQSGRDAASSVIAGLQRTQLRHLAEASPAGRYANQSMANCL